MVGRAISGQRGLEAIEQALGKLEREEAHIRTLAEQQTRARTEAETALAEGYRELARLVVDQSIADGVLDESDGLSSKVMRLLEDWQSTLKQEQQRWISLKADLEAARNKRHAAHQEVERARQAYDKAFVTAEKQLKQDPHYTELGKSNAEVQEQIKNARLKVANAASERDSKARPYHDDPLFMYLWTRGYGTNSYRANVLTRALDGWVARLIDYRPARENYAALTQIPERLQQYVARLEAVAVQVDAAIADSIRRTMVKKAGKDIAAEIAKLESALAELERQTVELEARFDELSDTVDNLAEGRQESFEEALAELSGLLAMKDLEQLVDEARQSRNVADDRIVGRIVNASRVKDKADERIENIHKQLADLAARRSDLLRIAAEFRRQRYDDAGSSFSKSDVFGDLLRQLLAGVITAGQYWAEVQRHQRWRRRASDRFPRFDDLILDHAGGGWPRMPGGFGGGMPRGGGISAGRPSRGGGFRTGGSF